MDKVIYDRMLESVDRQIKELEEDLKDESNFHVNEMQSRVSYITLLDDIEEV